MSAPSPSTKSERAGQPTLTVERQYFHRGQPTSELSARNELMEVRQFLTEPAKVGCAYGLTINLGNFESARVDVSVSMPCYVEELDAAYTQAKKWVEDRLQAEVETVRANKPSLF